MRATGLLDITDKNFKVVIVHQRERKNELFQSTKGNHDLKRK